VLADGSVLSYNAAATSWQALSGFAGVTRVAPSGLGFTLAIGTGGQLLASGDNTAGQLGQGDTQMHSGVLSVPGFATTSRVAVSSLSPSVIALKSDGSVWFWGADTTGQSGNGQSIGTSAPVQVIGLPATIRAIAAGGTFSAAL